MKQTKRQEGLIFFDNMCLFLDQNRRLEVSRYIAVGTQPFVRQQFLPANSRVQAIRPPKISGNIAT